MGKYYVRTYSTEIGICLVCASPFDRLKGRPCPKKTCGPVCSKAHAAASHYGGDKTLYYKRLRQERKARIIAAAVPNLVCSSCKGSFFSYFKKKYCSKKCKWKACRSFRRKKDVGIEVPGNEEGQAQCVTCNKSFKKNNAKHKYCSQLCLERVARRKFLNKNLNTEFICKVCKTPFLAYIPSTNGVKRTYDRKTCSRICQGKYVVSLRQ